ncbi:MED6-domain-containing protein [Pyrenophora teres f. maculata]|nr:MED6-domain-containing protein [Pyrenophora teres f. maculata]
MPPPIAPPDEQEFDQPQIIAGLLHPDLHAGNNVFWYFTSSPWFEAECLNINVWLNVRQNDPATAEQIMNDRKLWQQRLDDQPIGTQYVLAGEGQGEGHPWLLQRQNKVSVVKDDKEQIETFVEGNYYTHGTKMLMAPSLLDIIQSRLLTVSTRMQQMAELSKNMTHWTPATGYSYFPPSYEAAKAATTASRVGSPTLAPTDLDGAVPQSQSAGAAAATATATTTTQTTEPTASGTEFSDMLFLQSLNLTNAYGDEYMDENPLKGEPGAFVFEGTKTAVSARNKAQEQAAQATQQLPPTAALKIDTQTASALPSAAPTPKGGATPGAAPGTPGSKGSVGPAPKKKKDRRKSQGGLTSPTTPSVPQ